MSVMYESLSKNLSHFSIPPRFDIKTVFYCEIKFDISKVLDCFYIWLKTLNTESSLNDKSLFHF